MGLSDVFLRIYVFNGIIIVEDRVNIGFWYYYDLDSNMWWNICYVFGWLEFKGNNNILIFDFI